MPIGAPQPADRTPDAAMEGIDRGWGGEKQKQVTHNLDALKNLEHGAYQHVMKDYPPLPTGFHNRDAVESGNVMTEPETVRPDNQEQWQKPDRKIRYSAAPHPAPSAAPAASSSEPREYPGNPWGKTGRWIKGGAALSAATLLSYLHLAGSNIPVLTNVANTVLPWIHSVPGLGSALSLVGLGAGSSVATLLGTGALATGGLYGLGRLSMAIQRGLGRDVPPYERMTFLGHLWQGLKSPFTLAKGLAWDLPGWALKKTFNSPTVRAAAKPAAAASIIGGAVLGGVAASAAPGLGMAAGAGILTGMVGGPLALAAVLATLGLIKGTAKFIGKNSDSAGSAHAPAHH